MLQSLFSEGVSQGAQPSWAPHRPSLSTPKAWAVTITLGSLLDAVLRGADWNYLVQCFFTRTSQLKLICHCSLASQGALGTSKQMQKGNSILLRTCSPTKAAQWTKGLLSGNRDVRKEWREMECQGGQLSRGMCDGETSVG